MPITSAAVTVLKTSPPTLLTNAAVAVFQNAVDAPH
jgi:hypothetical protein